MLLLWLLLAWLPEPVAPDNLPALPPVPAAIQAAAPVARSKVLGDAAVLRQAQRSLQAQPPLQGSKIYVFDKIDFFDGVRPRIELAVQNPMQPETLLFYTFEHGAWTQSPAEDISHIKRLRQHLFALDSVDFARAAEIAATWQHYARRYAAVITEPYYVAYVHLPKQNKSFWHTATIEARGAQYYLSCHADGSIWEAKQLSGTRTDPPEP